MRHTYWQERPFFSVELSVGQIERRNTVIT